jgi:hypothetical protein
MWIEQFTMGFKMLRLMLEGQKATPAVVEEPALPVSSERFITQPVHAH